MGHMQETKMIGTMTGGAAIIAAMAMNAHADGMARVRARQEVNASHIIAGQLRQAQLRAFELASIAEKQQAEIIRLREQNKALEQNLLQRQRMIEIMSGRA